MCMFKKELDRPSQSESNKTLLWYPEAQIVEPEMETRGKYSKNYPMGAIIHFTAGRSKAGDRDALNTMTFGRKQGYAYFVVSSTGVVMQGHPLDRWGYHAGKSSYEGLGKSISSKLVGIEVCCAGKLENQNNEFKSWFGENYSENEVRYSKSKDNIQEGYYHKFNQLQEDALIKLLVWLKQNNSQVFQYKYVLGHDEVAPGRKNDPGASLSMTMSELRMKLRNFANTTRAS